MDRKEKASGKVTTDLCVMCEKPQKVKKERGGPSRIGSTNIRNISVQKRRAKQSQILALLSKYGSMALACRSTKTAQSTFRGWMEGDENFRGLVEDAQKQYLGVLEKEMHRRAVEGVKEPVVSAGRLVTYKKRYSDDLLKVLARANSPEKYGDARKTLGLKVGQEQDGSRYIKVYEGFDAEKEV